MAKEFIVYSATRASFEAQVASGEVDNTQIGIIAETGEMWWKGEYRPIAETAPFAKDLTGVLEATPEEFTFRTSAGTKSIRDESAVIRRIKGNTTVWSQSIPSPENWRAYSNENLSISVTGGVYRATLLQDFTDGVLPYRIGTYLTTPPHTIGHKYFVGGWLKTSLASSNNTFGLEMRGTVYSMYPAITSANTWTYVGRVFTLADLGSNKTIYLRPSWDYVNNGLAGNWYEAKDFVLIDLTALYGAGNEPSGDSANATVQAESIKQFKRLYPDSYYPYCAPEVRSMRATGIETIGDNAFNGNYAEVLGGEQYYLNGDYTSIGFSKTIGGELTAITIPNNKIYTPSERGYIRAVGTNISIQLVHSGIRNGEYHDYWRSTRWLPDIAKYFPDGMHGIGDVFDEINEEGAIKRFGVRAYEEGDYDNADVITDGTNTVYVLPLPNVIPITEPLQLDYKVADFGTEKMLSDLPSSPFRADIVYQFNAEGRIRDNARNIERLEEHTKDMATMDDVINAIPTEVATATQKSGSLDASGNTYIRLNIMYEYGAGLGESASFVLPPLFMLSGDYDYVWMLRLPAIATSSILSYPYIIKWKDGVAPTFSEPCTLEIYLKEAATGEIIGEWKIYR